MELILKQDIENLGLQYDIVKVKPGYGRNYLIPKGFAILATPQEKQKLQELLQQIEAEEKAKIELAKSIVEKLKETPVVLFAKAGNSGKLFGSLNNQDLSQALSEKGIEVDKKYIKIPGSTIKNIGKYAAKIRLHRSVEVDYEFEVAAEK